MKKILAFFALCTVYNVQGMSLDKDRFSKKSKEEKQAEDRILQDMADMRHMKYFLQKELVVNRQAKDSKQQELAAARENEARLRKQFDAENAKVADLKTKLVVAKAKEALLQLQVAQAQQNVG